MMINIYIDTSRLQHWHTSYLDANEIEFLNNIKTNNKIRFIMSFMHINEICIRDDKQSSLQLGLFLDSLSKKWIYNPYYLSFLELKNAIKKYNRSKRENTNPFGNNFIDTLKPLECTFLSPILKKYTISKALEALYGLQHNEFEKRRKDFIYNITLEWAPNNATLTKDLSKKEWRKRVVENFERTLKDKLSSFHLDTMFIKFKVQQDEFISWIKNNLVEIPSIWFTYCLQHQIHRDSQSKWGKGHMADINHLAALPYVDYMVIDKQMLTYANQACNFVNEHFNCNWENKLNNSITILAEKMESII